VADLGAKGRLEGVPPMIHPVLVITPAPGPLSKTISGNVYDDTNAGCVRTVRAYSRATGQLLGSTLSAAGTGAFSIAVPAGEVQRVVLDDDGGTVYNDLMDRVIPA